MTDHSHMYDPLQLKKVRYCTLPAIGRGHFLHCDLSSRIQILFSTGNPFHGDFREGTCTHPFCWSYMQPSLKQGLHSIPFQRVYMQPTCKPPSTGGCMQCLCKPPSKGGCMQASFHKGLHASPTKAHSIGIECNPMQALFREVFMSTFREGCI